MSDRVTKVMSEQGDPITTMVGPEHVQVVLENLEIVLDNDIPGAITEFGCNEGTTSLYITRFLKHLNSKRRFHVFDSFQGLPEKGSEDGDCDLFLQGSCKTTKNKLVENYIKSELPIPEIHEGLFNSFSSKDVPEYIAFAFLDSDFYSSIIDSLNIVYPRMLPGSRIVLHDYLYRDLPGVELACKDFLKIRPEKVINANGLGLIIKE